MNPPEASPESTPAPGPAAGAEAAAPPVRQVRELDWLKLFLLLPAYFLARLWGASWRFRMSAPEHAWLSAREQAVVILWHNRLFITGELYRRHRKHRPMVGLVSASRDGAWLAAFFRLLGIGAVRGSSSWRGSQALRELLAETQAGSDIAITPDGPRGPCYEIKPGALLAARQAHTPLLLISAHFHSAWRLRSWDRFYLPKPFSLVEVRTRWLPGYASLGAGEDDLAAAAEVRRLLAEITLDKG